MTACACACVCEWLHLRVRVVCCCSDAIGWSLLVSVVPSQHRRGNQQSAGAVLPLSGSPVQCSAVKCVNSPRLFPPFLFQCASVQLHAGRVGRADSMGVDLLLVDRRFLADAAETNETRRRPSCRPERPPAGHPLIAIKCTSGEAWNTAHTI